MYGYFLGLPGRKDEMAPLVRSLRLPQAILDRICKELGLRNVKDVNGLIEQAKIASLHDLYKQYGYAGKFTTTLYACPQLSPVEARNEMERLIRKARKPEKNMPSMTLLGAQEFSNRWYVSFIIEGSEIFILDETGTPEQKPQIEHCAIVLRPECSVGEIRASFGSSRIALEKLVSPLFRTGIEMDPIFIDEFSKGIARVTSATLDLALGPNRPGQVRLSSQKLSMGDRPDLRKIDDYVKYKDEGAIDAIAYVEKDGERQVRFQVNFRECRFSFKAYTGESDVEEVVREVERIAIKSGRLPRQRELHDFLGVRP